MADCALHLIELTTNHSMSKAAFKLYGASIQNHHMRRAIKRRHSPFIIHFYLTSTCMSLIFLLILVFRRLFSEASLKCKSQTHTVIFPLNGVTDRFWLNIHDLRPHIYSLDIITLDG